MDFSNWDNSSVVSDFFKEYFKERVIPISINHIARRIRINKFDGNIKPKLDKCGKSLIPPEHKTIGVSNADAVIYITNFNQSNDTVYARAMACERDPDTGR